MSDMRFEVKHSTADMTQLEEAMTVVERTLEKAIGKRVATSFLVVVYEDTTIGLQPGRGIANRQDAFDFFVTTVGVLLDREYGHR